MTDKVDTAIAATEPGPDFSRNVEVPILIASTGRPVILSIPFDVTDAELLELVTYMTLGNAQGLRARLRASRRSPLVVARGPIA